MPSRSAPDRVQISSRSAPEHLQLSLQISSRSAPNRLQNSSISALDQLQIPGPLKISSRSDPDQVQITSRSAAWGLLWRPSASRRLLAPPGISRGLSGLLGFSGVLLGASREPRNHLGLLLGALVVLLLGSSRSIFFEVVVFHLLGPLRVDFGSPR